MKNKFCFKKEFTNLFILLAGAGIFALLFVVLFKFGAKNDENQKSAQSNIIDKNDKRNAEKNGITLNLAYGVELVVSGTYEMKGNEISVRQNGKFCGSYFVPSKFDESLLKYADVFFNGKQKILVALFYHNAMAFRENILYEFMFFDIADGKLTLLKTQELCEENSTIFKTQGFVADHEKNCIEIFADVACDYKSIGKIDVFENETSAKAENFALEQYQDNDEKEVALNLGENFVANLKKNDEAFTILTLFQNGKRKGSCVLESYAPDGHVLFAELFAKGRISKKRTLAVLFYRGDAGTSSRSTICDFFLIEISKNGIAIKGEYNLSDITCSFYQGFEYYASQKKQSFVCDRKNNKIEIFAETPSCLGNYQMIAEIDVFANEAKQKLNW